MDAYSLAGLGSLSVLPIEMRHLVYRHVFADKYSYRPLSSPIGLLGASQALRHEATDTLYSHSTFKFECEGGPVGPIHRLQGPSQEVVNLLDHVEVVVHLNSLSLWSFTQDRNMEEYNEDIFCKLASTNRARKTCRVFFPKSGYRRIQWCRWLFLDHLGGLSSFRVVRFELECEPFDIEEGGLANRGPADLPPNMMRYRRGHRNYIWILSATEGRRTQLRSYLGETLGDCRSYEKMNLRCLEYRPRSY